MDQYFPFYIKCQGDAIKLKNQLINNRNVLVVINADNVICENQLVAGLLRATRSISYGKSIASKFAVEILLQIAGTHQIKNAVNLLDVKPSTSIIFFYQKKQETIISDSISGFPEFIVTKKILLEYGLSDDISSKNYCMEILAKGARLVTDYE